MSFFDIIVLGIVEGLTEFLPVSSTGHLILVSDLLGIGSAESTKAFEVIIQSGAILAVVWEYKRLLMQTIRGAIHKDPQAMMLLQSVAIAFIPAAVVGVLFSKWIKYYLFGTTPVAWALIVGGIFMIVVEKLPMLKKTSDVSFLNLPSRKALFIGIAQCFSLWPGVSRAMATIMGGRLIGLNPKHAAEFSFLLAIPTIFAASVYDLFKSRHSLSGDSLNVFEISLGMFVSFVVALVVIRAFLKFLTSHSLQVFGWYRIAVGFLFLIVSRS